MPWVDLSCRGVDEIVLNEERIPSIHEVDRDIVSDLKISVQSKEPLEDTIDRIVESDRIETIVAGTPKEVLVIVRSNVDCLS